MTLKLYHNYEDPYWTNTAKFVVTIWHLLKYNSEQILLPVPDSVQKF